LAPGRGSSLQTGGAPGDRGRDDAEGHPDATTSNLRSDRGALPGGHLRILPLDALLRMADRQAWTRSPAVSVRGVPGAPGGTRARPAALREGRRIRAIDHNDRV